MAQHALIGYRAFQTLKVIIRVFLEDFYAIGTTAKVHFLPGMLQRGRPLPWFFPQAGGANNQIARFLEVFPRIWDKEVNARLATKSVIFTVMAVSNGLLFADS